MTKFIELHTSATGKPTLVNIDLVRDVWIDVTGQVNLSFSLEDFAIVKEDYETVKRLVLEANNE